MVTYKLHVFEFSELDKSVQDRLRDESIKRFQSLFPLQARVLVQRAVYNGRVDLFAGEMPAFAANEKGGRIDWQMEAEIPLLTQLYGMSPMKSNAVVSFLARYEKGKSKVKFHTRARTSIVPIEQKVRMRLRQMAGIVDSLWADTFGRADEILQGHRYLANGAPFLGLQEMQEASRRVPESKAGSLAQDAMDLAFYRLLGSIGL